MANWDSTEAMGNPMTEELMDVAISRIHELKASGLTHWEEVSKMANFAKVVSFDAPIIEDTSYKKAFWAAIKPELEMLRLINTIDDQRN